MLLVKNGTICNADAMFKADVLIANEKIVQIAPSIAVPKNCRVIDATGKLVIREVRSAVCRRCFVSQNKEKKKKKKKKIKRIDTHTHCQLPFMGTVAVDDFNHGTRAAVAGGTTMLMDFVVRQKEKVC
jgi:dihydropyrimidinase